MDINRNNYEAWLLDFIEGRLSVKQVQQVRDFLLLNPDCASSLEEVEPWMLEVEKISFSGKNSLRRELPDQNSTVSGTGFDLFSIAMLEGDLTHHQEIDYLRMIEEDDEKMKEWLFWKRIRLTGETISFDHKAALKRRNPPRFRGFWISGAAAAAVLILFFSLFRIDQGFNPPAVIPPAANHSPEEAPITVEEPSIEPALLASKPAILSMKKHQDPPELTGQKMDTTPIAGMKTDLQVRPLRVAMLKNDLMKQPRQASYDRIEPLDLPLQPLYSERVEPDQLEEEGLVRTYREFMEEKDLSLLTIASAGVEGINRLAGSDLSLDVSRDQKGEVSGFSFRSAILSVDSPIRKQNVPR
ncbi:MAG: hypothetical protein R6W31_13960 [Bacteroidales bacterium]